MPTCDNYVSTIFNGHLRRDSRPISLEVASALTRLDVKDLAPSLRRLNRARRIKTRTFIFGV
jgi:hypothetical protein